MSEPIFRSIGVSRLRMVQDGDGVTTLVAGTGCPLKCQYCLNPQCFLPEGITATYTVDSLIDTVKIDDLYFRATGGGIVFGGGEPLLQADFIHAFRKNCPAEWRISLETSLNVPTESLKTVLEDIDLYIVDCKDMAPEIYHSYTAELPEYRNANLRFLAECHLQDKVLVRVPLIPGYNTDEDRKRSVDALKAMGYTRFDLFTYDTEHGKNKLKKHK